MTRAEQLLDLAARLEAAKADDWPLWEEINGKLGVSIWNENETIIRQARLLDRPDLLLSVALSWVPERRVWDLSSRSAATFAAAIVWSPEGGPPATRGRSSSPANALGAAALRARAEMEGKDG